MLVRDTVTGTVTVASRQDGPAGALFDLPFPARISADGRRVVFGAGGQLYVRDLPSNRTFLVSRGDGDGPPGDAVSFDPSISDDGSRVAFDSEAKNLGGGTTGNVTQVYVREVDAAHTVLVSRVNGAAGAPGDDDSRDPSISGDGRRVAFESFADNLGDGDTDDSQDVHMRDIDGGTTTLVDIGATGAKFDSAASPAVSGDGNRVAFLATTAGDSELYVRDLADKQLMLAGRADGVGGLPVTVDAAPGLSHDGNVVSFLAAPLSVIAPGAPGDGVPRQYVRRLAAAQTLLISRRSGADGQEVSAQVAEFESGNQPPGLTADGGCVMFDSSDPVAPGATSTDFVQSYMRVLTPDCGRPPVVVPPVTGGGGGGGPVGGGGGTPPPRDRTAPRLTSVRLSRSTFRIGPAHTALRATTGHGTTLSLKVSEASRLSVVVDRQRLGHRNAKSHRCTVVRKRPAHGACTAYSHDGTLVRQVRAGAVKIAFSGRLGGRRLALGRHRLTITARDAAGNTSRSVSVRFTIVR